VQNTTMSFTGLTPTFVENDKFDRMNWTLWQRLICLAANQQGAMGYLEGFIKQPVRTKNTNYITNPSIPCWRSNSCQDKEDRCLLLITTWCMFSGILLSAKVLKYGCVIIYTLVLIVFEILRLVCITIYILFILTVTRF